MNNLEQAIEQAIEQGKAFGFLADDASGEWFRLKVQKLVEIK